MSTIYVAHSARLAKWALGVGLGKHVYKVGVTDEPLKPLIAAGWAGEADWKLLAQRPVEDVSEEEALARLGAKEKLVEPRLYPKIKDTPGIFKVSPVHVENQILISRALAGEERLEAPAIKPAEVGNYLIDVALR